MMSESFEFRQVSHFTAGTIGEPGNRTFFLQVGDGSSVATVRLEKQQVRALAQFLRDVLEDLPATGQQPSAPLIEPTHPAWTVGQIAVGVDEADAEVVLVIEELLLGDEDVDGLDIGDDLDDLEDGTGAKIRAHIGAAQAAGFIAASDELMEGGRPPCRLCGQPLDPGHVCPRLN